MPIRKQSERFEYKPIDFYKASDVIPVGGGGGAVLVTDSLVNHFTGGGMNGSGTTTWTDDLTSTILTAQTSGDLTGTETNGKKYILINSHDKRLKSNANLGFTAFPCTIQLVLKFAAVPAIQGLFIYYEPGQPTSPNFPNIDILLLGHSNTTGIYSQTRQVSTYDATNYSIQPSSAFQKNSVVVITQVNTNATTTMYYQNGIKGVLDSTLNTNYIATFSSAFRCVLGSYENTNIYPANAKFYELAIYNKALSEAEVIQNCAYFHSQNWN